MRRRYRPFGRVGRTSRQPDQNPRRQYLATGQRTHPTFGRKHPRRDRRRDRFSGRRGRGKAHRQDLSLPSRRHPLSDPRRADLSRHQRRLAPDLRQRRALGDHRGHGLSDQGHPRGPVYRRAAGQALRTARIDRHRQIDQRRADPPQDMRGRARRAHRDDRSARRILRRVPAHRFAARRFQPPHAVLANELRGTLRGLRDRARLRSAGRSRHPRQVPADSARQKPARRKHGQDHRRFADPLSAVRSVERHPERDGSARQGHLDRAVHAAQDQDRRDQGRSALSVHVLRHAGRRYHGRIHRQGFPPALERQADLDHRRFGSALGYH